MDGLGQTAGNLPGKQRSGTVVFQHLATKLAHKLTASSIQLSQLNADMAHSLIDPDTDGLVLLEEAQHTLTQREQLFRAMFDEALETTTNAGDNGRNAAFQETDLTLLSILANQAAVSQENAQLYARVRQELQERRRAEEENRRTMHLLRERVKEQSLLYRISRLLQADQGADLDATFQRMVDMLPSGWQHPESTAARLSLDKTYRTENFKETEWLLQSSFRTADGNEGIIEVVYLEEVPATNEDAFLEEERQLLDAIGEMVHSYLDRIIATKALQQERELEQYIAQQEQLAAVGQLAAGIAHDFNNILSAIILYAQLLQHEASLSERNSENLATISSQAQHAVDLVRQLLDFSRRAVMERSSMNMVPFCKELINLMERTLPETSHLELHYDENKYIVNADPTRLQQALMNLMVNASDAMPDGGQLKLYLSSVDVRPGACPSFPELEPGQWLRLNVSDTGTGIQEDHLNRIFEPFFTTKSKLQGTGLGLAQVYGIVKQHDGHIAVESEIGQGTTFSIYLRLIQPDLPVETGVETQSDHAHIHFPAVVLLVEDNPVTRKAIRATLERLGCRVLVAANGEEALETFDSHQASIDLVLSDMVMPQLGGLDLYRTLAEREPNLNMIVMTGYPLEEKGKHLLEKGEVTWLEKPFTIDALTDVLQSKLHRTTV